MRGIKIPPKYLKYRDSHSPKETALKFIQYVSIGLHG